MLGSFDVELQKVDLFDTFLSQEIVAPHYRTLHPLAGPVMWIVGEGRVRARAVMIVEGHSTAALGQAEIERLNSLRGSDSRPELGCGCRHSFQRVDRRFAKHLLRYERPVTNVGPDIEDGTNCLSLQRREQPALTVSLGLVASIAEPFEVLPAELRYGLQYR